MKTYDLEATRDLCKYLYIVSDATPNSLTRLQDLPQGVTGELSAAPGMVSTPMYEELGLEGSGFSVRPILYLAKLRDYKSMDLLIAHVCCIHDGKKSLFYSAFSAQQQDKKEKATPKLLKYLLSRGADPGIRSDWGVDLHDGMRHIRYA